MKIFLRRASLFLIITVFCFASSQTQKAYALLGAGDIVVDPVNLVENGTSAVANVANGVTAVAGGIWDRVAKPALNVAAYTVAQKALEQMTNNTVRWIQGGFQGNPRFAVDTNRLRDDTLDIVTTDLSNQLQGSALCDFDPNFKINLLVNVDSRDKILKQKVACPFAKMLLTDPKATQKFYENFKNGGWIGFQSALQDSGNPFGVGIIVSGELSKKRSEELANQATKLSWAKGFTDSVDTSNCSYPPGTEEALKKGPDDPNYIPPEARKAYEQAYCATKTPGATIAGQLDKALGVESDRLNLANDMDKIFSAAIGQLTKQATEGIFNALSPQQQYAPRYRMTDPSTGIAGLVDVQQVTSDQNQLEGVQKRKDSAFARVQDLFAQMSKLRSESVSLGCPNGSPLRCAEIKQSLTDLQTELDSAKKSLERAIAALEDARNTLSRSIEKADRAKAVKLTADAYNVLLFARISNPKELSAATTAEKFEKPLSGSTRSAIVLVRNTFYYYTNILPVNAYTASTTAALIAKKAASTYQANVEAADAALREAQKNMFALEDLLLQHKKILTDLQNSLGAANARIAQWWQDCASNSFGYSSTGCPSSWDVAQILGTLPADIARETALIKDIMKQLSVIGSNVDIARANAFAVRGIAPDGVTCLPSVTPVTLNCSGKDNVAKWIADAQIIINDADTLQKARTTVIDIATQSGATF